MQLTHLNEPRCNKLKLFIDPVSQIQGYVKHIIYDYG